MEKWWQQKGAEHLEYYLYNITYLFLEKKDRKKERESEIEREWELESRIN